MKSKIILSLVIILSAASLSAGQGAHYPYPFSVRCPDRIISPGETITINAEFEGGHIGERYSPIYNWIVSAGTIVGGQGTPSITVGTLSPEDFTDSVTVTLERRFSEAHFPGVQREASCAFHVLLAPQPRMIDEFRTSGNNCEEGFARLDVFLVELNNNPNDQGVIVLYGDVSDARASSRREIELRNHLVSRKFPPDRVTFIRGGSKVRGTTQFWIVPPGAETPTVERAAEPERATEPYLYAQNYIDGVAGCSGHQYDVAAYGNELKSQPGSRGRVVISQSSPAKYRRELNVILRGLGSKGLPRSRITAVYKYVGRKKILEGNELWIIPAKK
jgi:hypothetical protein